MAEADIPAQEPLSKPLKLAPCPFDLWAARQGYDTAPAVSPCPLRQYADGDTQKAFEAWNAGAQSIAQMLTETTIETDGLREKLGALVCSTQE